MASELTSFSLKVHRHRNGLEMHIFSNFRTVIRVLHGWKSDTVRTPVSWVSRFSGCRHQALCLMATATDATTTIATMAAAT